MKVECRRVLLRDELQNMQNKPLAPTPVSEPILDPHSLYMMYHMQQMIQQPQSWNMNKADSDSQSVQESKSLLKQYSQSGKNLSLNNEPFIDELSQPELDTHLNVEVVKPANRNSGGSNRAELGDDNISTRPRAYNHLSAFDLKNLQNSESVERKPKPPIPSNIEINIRNVEELLDDDDPLQQGSFSNKIYDQQPQKKVRSVENSGFNSIFGQNKLTGSGWSDNLGSKFTKTKTTRDSGSNLFQRSFGEPKNPQDLSAIFETTGGPFFAWDEQPLQAKKEEYFEGFKLVEPKQSKRQFHNSFRSDQVLDHAKVEERYYSSFLETDEQRRGSLFPITSNESEEDNSQADKLKSSSEF